MSGLNPQSAIRHPQSPVGESELLSLTRNGDQEAFSRLVLRHQDRIYNALVRFTGDRDRALDLAQKTFLNAWLKLAQYEEKAAFGTWLYRIAINLAISDARARKGGPVSLAQVGAGREEEADYDPPDPGPDPAGQAVSGETQALVQAAIRALDEEHRAVVVMRDIEGRSYDEIADILNVPKGTVRSRLHRARMELKTKLERIMK